MHAIFIVLAVLLAVLVLPVWWAVSDRAQARKAAQAQVERRTEAEARRRNFKRQVYPALDYVMPSPCRNAPDIPSQLDMAESLVSDTGALMSCHVILDGEEALGPFGNNWLEGRAGTRIRRMADLENIARRHAHQEWLVKFVQPLHSMVYQRHADGQWNLVRVGGGMF